MKAAGGLLLETGSARSENQATPAEVLHGDDD